MKPNSSIEITNNTVNHQFETLVEGRKGEMVYRLRDNKIHLMHGYPKRSAERELQPPWHCTR
jgi:hypothetical protein